MIYSQVLATGGYVPANTITNDHFEYLVENANEWISSRTGIRERRFASDTEATSDLATAAAKDALQKGEHRSVIIGLYHRCHIDAGHDPASHCLHGAKKYRGGKCLRF